MMKCVYSVNEFSSNSLVSSELFGETWKENADPCFQLLKALKATLTVTKDGYTVKNVHKEIVRQGTATDVFEIYDSMPISVDPLQVETPNFVGM